MLYKLIKCISALLLLLALTPSHAKLFMCPDTYRYINIGDTIDQIAQACGQPMSKTSEEVSEIRRVPTEQWFYEGLSQGYTQSGFVHLLYEKDMVADIKAPQGARLVFTFKKGKVSSIDIGGNDAGSTSWCGENKVIKPGDAKSRVRRLCGHPSTTNIGTSSSYGGLVTKETWRYKLPADQGSMTLIFQAGKLISIK